MSAEIQPGERIYLRAARFGQPGTVIRQQRGKLTVYWPDMDFWSRHRPEALEQAEGATTEAGRRQSE
jgi:hypothetical protein